MVKKSSGKKRTRRDEAQEIVEDLDLDVGDYAVADEDVIHNRRRKRRAGADEMNGSDDDDGERMAAVLPSDAHKLEGYDDDDDERGAHLEEESLARAANKSMRRQVDESDFDIGAISAKVKPARRVGGGAASNLLSVAPVIEAIERDYASLSSSERLAMVQKESPEMVKIMEEMRQHLTEVRELAKPLQELLFQRRVSEADRNLVNFLETKVQLMLSYCMHATFYLLLKANGQKVSGHPVIDNLVEIRTYLEKLFPLEEKLQYSINRLLSGKTTSAARLDTLRPLQNGERGAIASSAGVTEGKKNRKQLENLRAAEAMEQAELAAMNRTRTKKRATALGDESAVDHSAATAALGYREGEDQFFAKIAGYDDDDEDEDEGLSLIERLRRRQRAVAAALGKSDDNDGNKKKNKTNKNINSGTAVEEDGEVYDDDDDEDYGDDEDDYGDDEDLLSEGEEGEGEYDTLLAEEQQRQQRDAKAAAAPRAKLAEPELDRRKAGKKIEAHRGLTRARPRDRKTPRTAQRRKYEKGMRIHKAQVRTVAPEPEGGFVGVTSIKSSVVRSTRL